MVEILIEGVKINVEGGERGDECGGHCTSALKQGYWLPIKGQN